MKKSELSFKCVLGSEKRNKRMYDAIIRAGIKNHIREEDFVKTAMCLRIDDTWMKEVSPTYASKITESYEDSTIPEVTFETALEMLASIEPDAPEFDIKPFDRVLIKMKSPSHAWEIDIYREIYRKEHSFVCMHTYPEQIVKYEGNEHFFDEIDMPKSWWECENGKPVWKTK